MIISYKNVKITIHHKSSYIIKALFRIYLIKKQKIILLLNNTRKKNKIIKLKKKLKTYYNYSKMKDI